LVQLPLHRHVMLGATDGRDRGENSAREVCAVDLDPTTNVLVPPTNISSGASIAVCGEIREDVRLRNLVWIVDPVPREIRVSILL
jgi:hypothetical protein